MNGTTSFLVHKQIDGILPEVTTERKRAKIMLCISHIRCKRSLLVSKTNRNSNAARIKQRSMAVFLLRSIDALG
jgi:hypothetical protein